MQNISFKKVHLFFIVSLFLSFVLTGQNTTSLLETADSLFLNKKYTESLEVYEKIFKEEQKSSHTMLLKMAFIKEGLGDYANALFYLNVYFKRTLDPKVLSKINELAESNNLTGYSTPEATLISGVVSRYSDTIRLTFVFILIAWLGLTIMYASKKKKQPLLSYTLLFCFATVLIFGNNMHSERKDGIIVGNTTYLMDGPSGASNVIKIVDKGHKVRILGKEGLWTKIDWEGEALYLRENRILELI